MQGNVCIVCSKQHEYKVCPELTAPLRDGFFRGGGQGGGHSHDDEESCQTAASCANLSASELPIESISVPPV
jgi:hypothetical protein